MEETLMLHFGKNKGVFWRKKNIKSKFGHEKQTDTFYFSFSGKFVKDKRKNLKLQYLHFTKV